MLAHLAVLRAEGACSITLRADRYPFLGFIDQKEGTNSGRLLWHNGSASQALAMLCEAEVGARQGKHQYLSGVLHNAAKILEANAEHPTDPAQALQALGLSPSECAL